MNSDVLKGQWKQVKGDIQKEWGKLTDSDVEKVGGERAKLEGSLQEHYGYAKEEAAKHVNDFLKKFESR